MKRTKKKGTVKLRRRIRKTVASIFMIMAVVVASIPVENLGTMQAASTRGASLDLNAMYVGNSDWDDTSLTNGYNNAINIVRFDNAGEPISVFTALSNGNGEAMITSYNEIDTSVRSSVTIAESYTKYTYQNESGTEEAIYLNSNKSAPSGDVYTKTTDTMKITAIDKQVFKKSTFEITDVSLPTSLTYIGSECFKDQSSLSAISIPEAVKVIGGGCFYGAGVQTVVFKGDFTKPIEIKPFAFYNCARLTSVTFPTEKPVDLGTGCFSYGKDDNEKMTSFAFPDAMTEIANDYILAGRKRLASVELPSEFGTSSSNPKEIPVNTLAGCEDLGKLVFGENSDYAYFSSDLLQDIRNDNFIVVGPDCQDTGDTPRTSTWKATIDFPATVDEDAKTYYVPYQYTKSGKTHIEIGRHADDGSLVFIEQIDVLNEANKTAVLSGYRFPDATQTPQMVDIEILGTVGSYKIKEIGNGCFSSIKDYIQTVFIADDAEIDIESKVFEDCNALEKVTIGSSVRSIGSRAFAGCELLENVYFSRTKTSEYGPDDSYWSELKIASDAFKTGSVGLTFYGDINPDYAPFKIASNTGNSRTNELTTGNEILYMTGAPENLKVIKDRTEGLMTLVDYPNDAPTIDIPKGVQSINTKQYFGKDEKNLSNGANVLSASQYGLGYDENGNEIYSDGLFVDNTTIEEIAFCSTLEDVGTLPFTGCTKLYNIDTTSNSYFEFDNMLFYSTNPKNRAVELEILQCLPSRGNEGKYGSNKIDSTTNPNLASVVSIAEYAFQNCDKIRVVDLRKTTVAEIPMGCFEGCTYLSDVELPETVVKIEASSFSGLKEDGTIYIHIPNKDTDISDSAFDGETYIYAECVEGSPCYQDLESIQALLSKSNGGINVIIMNPEIIEPIFDVKFVDKETGKAIDTLQVNGGKSILSAPEVPTHTGKTFKHWEWYDADSETYYYGKEAYQNVTEDRVVYAIYVDSDSSTDGSGDSNNGTDGSGGNNGSNGNNSSNGNNGSNGSNGSDGTGSSGQKYTVTVNYGSGSGEYEVGAAVTITAYAPESSTKVFSRWTSANTGVGFANATSSTTSFTMPASAVTITANYKTRIAEDEEEEESSSSTSNRRPVGGSSTTTTTVTTTPGTTTNTTQTVVNGNSEDDKLYINKNGVSNKDVGTASVDGSTDNFVVKIADAENYLEQIKQALINEYGSLDGIMYFPMDINLYDATGKNKVTDTYGLDINVTMPIPDVLIQYGGNAKVAAVENNYLQKLNPKFKTIDGIACISFTPPHFSPYVIYVDTNNLVAGLTYDATPATGDTLHPKWFVVIGMASFSIFLFVTGDKKRKVSFA